MTSALPPVSPLPLPKIFPQLPQRRQFATPRLVPSGSSEFGLRAQTGADKAAAAGPAPTPSGPAPVCEHSCGIDLLFGAVGSLRATGSGSGDPVAALSRLYPFVPPGAGRAHVKESAPGAPAFTSPIERPG
jgi:hypothetical protein